MANVYRADQLGPLIAPVRPTDASAADETIRSLLALQKQCGIDVFSDGQLRRTSPCSIFAGAVGGIHSETGALPYAAGPLERRQRLTAGEVEFLKRNAGGFFKICLPAPTAAAMQLFRAGITDAHYPTRRDLAFALAGIVREEIQNLIADGVPYIQLDCPAYEIASNRAGASWFGTPEEMLRLDADALKDLGPHAGTVAVHLPRCAQAPAGQDKRVQILTSAFERMPVNRFLVEFHEPQEADFAPLKALDAGRMAVLGLVDPLAPRDDEFDPLLDTLDQAVTCAPPERLALSPRQAFAVVEGLSCEEAATAQQRALTLTVETARRFWGFET